MTNTALLDRSMVEELAATSQAPVDLVERVYRVELTSLESHARIRLYLPIIARRRAREVLRQRQRSHWSLSENGTSAHS